MPPLDKRENEIEKKNVNEEQSNDPDGVDHGVPADKVKENVVWGAVTAHKEHIVTFAVGKNVDNIRRNAKARKNCVCDGNVFLFHTRHTRDDYVKSGKAGYGVGDSRHDVNKGDNGIRRVVVSRKICAEHRTEKAEDGNEIERRLLHSARRECRKRYRDKLYRAKEEREHADDRPAVRAMNNDLYKLKAVDKNCRKDEHLVLVTVDPVSHFEAKIHRTRRHNYHKNGNERQMLPGHIALGLTRKAKLAKPEKLANDLLHKASVSFYFT